MTTKFQTFMKELESEARAQGPDAMAELRYFRQRFRVARRIAQARKKRGFSQKELARRTGIHQSEISTIENGEANPTFRTLQTLASALGGRIELVFGT